MINKSFPDFRTGLPIGLFLVRSPLTTEKKGAEAAPGQWARHRKPPRIPSPPCANPTIDSLGVSLGEGTSPAHSWAR
jgi:hypothetical protein